MFEPPAPDQGLGGDQRLDHRLVGIALVTLVIDDTLALEAWRIAREAAIAVDGEGDGGVDAAPFELGRILHPNVKVVATVPGRGIDRKSTRLNSSHLGISYAVFCLKKK